MAAWTLHIEGDGDDSAGDLGRKMVAALKGSGHTIHTATLEHVVVDNLTDQGTDPAAPVAEGGQ